MQAVCCSQWNGLSIYKFVLQSLSADPILECMIAMRGFRKFSYDEGLSRKNAAVVAATKKNLYISIHLISWIFLPLLSKYKSFV